MKRFLIVTLLFITLLLQGAGMKFSDYPAINATNLQSTDLFLIARPGSPGTNYKVSATGMATAASVNAKLSTNTIGATVNALTYGLIADGVTDNTVTLSNLLNGASNVFFPSGVYLCANPVIVSRTVNILGTKGAEFRYTGSSNSYFLTLNAPDSTVRMMRFVGGNGTNYAASSSGGAISLNATGFPAVEGCSFESWNGNCIFFEGTGNLYTRSNHCLINGNAFYKTWSPIVGGANEKTEFSTISYNRASVFGGTGIKVSDPNIRIFGNEMLGYMSDTSGTIDTPQTSYGLKVIITNSLNRGHCTIVGNNFSHNEYDIWIEGVHGFQDSGMITLGNNIIGGGHYSIITNCVQLQITGGLIGPSATITPLKIMNCTNVGLAQVTIQGAWDLGGTVGLQIGSSVYSNGVLLAMTGNGGSLTNLTTNSSPSLAANIESRVGTNTQTQWRFRSDASIVLGTGGRGGGAGEIEADGFYGGSFFGNGTSLTNLNASNLASGTVPNARLTNNAYTNLSLVAGNATNLALVNATNNGAPVAIYGGATTSGTVPIYNGTSGINGAGTNLTSSFAGAFAARSVTAYNGVSGSNVVSSTTITATNGFQSLATNYLRGTANIPMMWTNTWGINAYCFFPASTNLTAWTRLGSNILDYSGVGIVSSPISFYLPPGGYITNVGVTASGTIYAQ